MKSILLALALITSGAYAADDADFNPCDAVENDQQTLACSVFSRNAAEQLGAVVTRMPEVLKSAEARAVMRALGAERDKITDYADELEQALDGSTA